MRVEWKQNLLFPMGVVIKCFVMPPNSKMEQTTKKKIYILLDVVWHTNLQRFEGVRPDHVRGKS